MTMRTPTEPNRFHFQQGQLMLQDQILGYIAYRRQQDASYVTISKEVGMTDGWVSDICGGKIQVMKTENREKATRLLAAKYGAEGVPYVDSSPSVRPAAPPPDALHEGFGRHAGDPTRPLAPPPPLDATYDGITEADATEEIAAEVASLVEEKTPQELAELLVQARDHAASLNTVITSLKGQHAEALGEVARVQRQFTDMDNTRIRLGAEIAERDRLIEALKDDGNEYERAIGMQNRRIEDLQGFKDGTIAQLRQFAALLWQVVPPEGWPQVQVDYKMAGTETGRFSSAEPVRANLPYSGELGGAAYREYLQNLPDAEPFEVEFQGEWKPKPISLEVNGVKTTLHCATEEEEKRLQASLDNTAYSASVEKYRRDALDIG